MTHGLLIIDKPGGPSSHDVVNEVRRLTGIRRVGHTGTLDPMATGILILCLGRATRLAEYLTGQDKRYLGTIRLGEETDTYDAEGLILVEKPVAVTRQEALASLDHFRGEIKQLAPRYSAVKIGGEALYKLTRRGERPERPVRRVHVAQLELVDWKPPELSIDLTCSSGTYVRTIAHDLGQLLGCGAHLKALRRLAVGGFTIERVVSLDDLSQSNWMGYLLPLDEAVAHFTRVDVSRADASRLTYGLTIESEKRWQEEQLLRVYDEDGKFVGVTYFAEAELHPKKIFYDL